MRLSAVWCWANAQRFTARVASAERQSAARLLRQAQILGVQLFFGFHVARVIGNAVDRTHDAALRRIVVAHALSAELGIDHVDFLARSNRAVRAFGLANVAVDAFVGDDQRHRAAYPLPPRDL